MRNYDTGCGAALSIKLGTQYPRSQAVNTGSVYAALVTYSNTDIALSKDARKPIY